MIWPIAEIGSPLLPGWTGEHGLRPFAAELWLLAGIVSSLIVPFFARRSNLASGYVALASLVLALISLLLTSDGASGSLFRGMLLTDPFAVFWKAMLLMFVIGVVLMWFCTDSRTMHEGDGPEYFVLLLGATLGLSLMGSTTNLLMMFMAVELASLPSYVLAGFRKTDRIGAEASLKYVLFGAVSAAIMVYGLSILYGLHGTLQLEQLAADWAKSGGGALMVVAIVGLVVGIGFKIAAVPFHFWCPDVFEGASVSVSAFLSVASKGAGLVLLMRVMLLLADGAGESAAGAASLTALAVGVGILGAVTATVGNLAAFVQQNMKRLLAYSSIAHAGYMLCAVAALIGASGAQWEPDGTMRAPQALLLYLAVYLFMNLGAFVVVGLVHRHTGRDDLEGFSGLGRRSPLLAVCMVVFLFSLVGLPPLAGFMAKLNVMVLLGRFGGWHWALVIVIGVNTILSLYYYARVVKAMYLQEEQKPAFAAGSLGVSLSLVCALMLLIMMIGFGPLQSLTSAYSRLVEMTPPMLKTGL